MVTYPKSYKKGYLQFIGAIPVLHLSSRVLKNESVHGKDLHA